jgi:sigma-B regulation protein RsbU (phosphoserine phosphatase)
MPRQANDSPRESPNGLSSFPITVLLVDDQAIIGEAVRRMLAGEPDITLHYCQDPTKAMELASQVRPTVILQDLVMPEVDGLTLVKFFRANPATRDTPMIVLSSKEEPLTKAEAFAVGANDYLVKLPDRIELLARIRYHSRGYISLLERNEAFEALRRSQEHLAREIAAGDRFVRSLLPEPATTPIRVDWRYIPCADLGGDTFGYHWMDEDRFAVYLLDVSGNGLDSALFSVTVMNVLRSRSLNADFANPGQILGALNEAFPMDLYDGKYFTIWYGIYSRRRSELSWCNGGHPPALLFPGSGAEEPMQLPSEGPIIGAFPGVPFETQCTPVPPGSRLYVFSDGVQEIHRREGGDWSFEEFVEFMSRPADPSVPLADRLLAHVRQLKGSDLLDDDFSIIEVVWPGTP